MDHWAVVALGSMAVGFASGILSALAGVGGAVLTTPGIRALGASPITAVGSTVPAILPSAITGTLRYAKEGLVQWRVALWCGGAGTVSAFAGAWTAGQVDARWLMVATALLVIWSSASQFRAEARTEATRRRLRSLGAAAVADLPVEVTRTATPLLVAVGLGAGFLAGLLGIGGGLVLVPAFTTIVRLPVKQTIATSLVAVACMSVASLIGHAIAGNIDWTFAVPLAIGVIPGARIGSRITVRVSDRAARLTCGTLLAVIGVVYLVTELSQLL